MVWITALIAIAGLGLVLGWLAHLLIGPWDRDA